MQNGIGRNEICKEVGFVVADFDKTSMTNIDENQSHLLWAHLISLYIITFFTIRVRLGPAMLVRSPQPGPSEGPASFARGLHVRWRWPEHKHRGLCRAILACVERGCGAQGVLLAVRLCRGRGCSHECCDL